MASVPFIGLLKSPQILRESWRRGKSREMEKGGSEISSKVTGLLRSRSGLQIPPHPFFSNMGNKTDRSTGVTPHAWLSPSSDSAAGKQQELNKWWENGTSGEGSAERGNGKQKGGEKKKEGVKQRKSRKEKREGRFRFRLFRT